jgi:RNA polymerase sigma-70 factor (ECF subfamily)
MKPARRLRPSNEVMTELPVRPDAGSRAVVLAAPAERAPETVPPEEAGPADSALVDRARRGDELAFRRLVVRHRDHAYGLALRITRSPEDAEEVAQEAFVRAWLALREFRGDASFGTWLHRIVARRALDYALARRRRESRQMPVAAAEDEPVADAGAGRDVILARRIERLTAQLSAAQQAVVALFYGEDQPVAQIAEALDMPENTVKTHLRRARGALRRAWSLEEGTAP